MTHVGGRAPVSLPTDVIRASADPRDLLEEVWGQLQVGAAWMTERGIATRCRLAKNVSEVIGALIELERQGRAVSKDRDTKFALWRSSDSTTPPPSDPPEPNYFGRRDRISPTSPRYIPPARPATQVPSTSPEVNMNAQTTKRMPRSAPILEALAGGPLTRDQIAEKTGLDAQAVSETLSSTLKVRVKKNDDGTWQLRAGAALARAPKAARKPIAREPTRRVKKRRKVRRALPPPAAKTAAPAAVVGLRWYVGNDGSVRFVFAGIGPGEKPVSVELSPEQFDTVKRAHAVVRAAPAIA